jgi:hypothetical protein
MELLFFCLVCLVDVFQLRSMPWKEKISTTNYSEWKMVVFETLNGWSTSCLPLSFATPRTTLDSNFSENCETEIS